MLLNMTLWKADKNFDNNEYIMTNTSVLYIFETSRWETMVQSKCKFTHMSILLLSPLRSICIGTESLIALTH